jgi:hypothetical protein
MQLFGLEAVGLIRYSNIIILYQSSKPCPAPKLYSPVSCCGGTGSNPRPTMWDLWYTNWHWHRFFSLYLGFPLSVQFHQYFIHFHLITDALQHSISNKHASFNAILSKTLCRVITITKVGTAREYFPSFPLPCRSRPWKDHSDSGSDRGDIEIQSRLWFSKFPLAERPGLASLSRSRGPSVCTLVGFSPTEPGRYFCLFGTYGLVYYHLKW